MVKAAASGPGGVLPSSNYILTPQKRKRERLFLCRKKQTYLLSFCQINTLSFYQHRKVLYTYPRPEISNLANQPTNQLLVLLALWTLLTSSEFRKPAPKISLLFSYTKLVQWTMFIWIQSSNQNASICEKSCVSLSKDL